MWGPPMPPFRFPRVPLLGVLSTCAAFAEGPMLRFPTTPRRVAEMLGASVAAATAREELPTKRTATQNAYTSAFKALKTRPSNNSVRRKRHPCGRRWKSVRSGGPVQTQAGGAVRRGKSGRKRRAGRARNRIDTAEGAQGRRPSRTRKTTARPSPGLPRIQSRRGGGRSAA